MSRGESLESGGDRDVPGEELRSAASCHRRHVVRRRGPEPAGWTRSGYPPLPAWVARQVKQSLSLTFLPPL